MAKKRPLTIGGTVQDGKLLLDDRRFFDLALKAWDGRVTVTVAPEEQIRSQRAHNYLFAAVYTPAVRDLIDAGYDGLTVDFLHDCMKKAFNGEDRPDPITGELVRFGKSTKKLSVEDFGIFIERVMECLAVRYGMTFEPPRPSEDWRDRKVAA